MNQVLSLAVYERQRELNEIREAVNLPVGTDHEALLDYLRLLKSHWDADR